MLALRILRSLRLNAFLVLACPGYGYLFENKKDVTKSEQGVIALKNLLEGKLEAEIFAAFVSNGKTLADAKREMEKDTGCHDVFVAQSRWQNQCYFEVLREIPFAYPLFERDFSSKTRQNDNAWLRNWLAER